MATPSPCRHQRPAAARERPADAISNWGGPGYFWLPTEDFDGLPLANFAVQLGQHIRGHTP